MEKWLWVACKLSQLLSLTATSLPWSRPLLQLSTFLCLRGFLEIPGNALNSLNFDHVSPVPILKLLPKFPCRCFLFWMPTCQPLASASPWTRTSEHAPRFLSLWVEGTSHTAKSSVRSLGLQTWIWPRFSISMWGETGYHTVLGLEWPENKWTGSHTDLAGNVERCREELASHYLKNQVPEDTIIAFPWLLFQHYSLSLFYYVCLHEFCNKISRKSMLVRFLMCFDKLHLISFYWLLSTAWHVFPILLPVQQTNSYSPNILFNLLHTLQTPPPL